MENQLILIADNDAKNLEILRENLEAAGFLVTAASNGKDAWNEITRNKPKLVLTETNLPGMTGFQLMERLKSDPETAPTPVILLTKQRDVQQRLRAFELGAKDYLVKPLHVKEVIAHIRMILRRLQRFDADASDMQNQFTGKLDQLNLSDLIESFGVERKTGILTLSNGRRSGQVFFRDGAIVNARLGDFKMEQALYQMFPWKKGFFKMIFREVDIAEEISISNLGLLLQGLKRMELREKLLKKLPSPEATFHVTPIFKQLLEKKKSDNGVNEFTRLLDGKHTVEQIIDESGLDDLIALKRLVRLYEQGFVKTDARFVKKKEQPEHEKVLADFGEDSFSERLSSRPTFPAAESDVRYENNGEDKEPSEDEPIFPGLEDEKIYEPSEKDIFHQDSPPSLELRQERKDTVEFSETAPTEEPRIAPQSIDTNKSLFEEVFLDNESKESASQDKEQMPVDDQAAADSSEITTSEPPENSSVLTDDSIEDYVFEIAPRRNEEDLEKEIKPLISEIESNNLETEKPTAEIDKNKISDEGAIIDNAEETTSKAPAQQEIYADEELLLEAVKHQGPQEKIVPDSKIPATTSDQGVPEEEIPYQAKSGDKVVLISVDEDCKDSVMDILTHDNFASLKVLPEQNFTIDVGKINLTPENEIKLISVPIEKQLNPFLESIEDSTLACLFTFDCSRPETWEYTNYLIHSISDKFGAPFAVLVMNLDEQESLTIDVIRYKLNLSSENVILPCDETDENCVRQLLDTVKNFAGII